MEEKPLVIGGKSYISSKRAAILFHYTTDYIGQLSRSKKIGSVLVGRDRYVDYSSLVAYVDSVANGTTVSKESLNHTTGTSGQSRQQVDSQASKLPNQTEMRRREVPLVGVHVWATSTVLCLGLILFFGATSLGRGIVSGVIDSSESSFSNSAPLLLTSSAGATLDIGDFLVRVDEEYIGFLRDTQRVVAKLLRTGRESLVAYIGPFVGMGETRTIIVKNNIPATGIDRVTVPVQTGTVGLGDVGLGEAEVRLIAQEIVDTELAKTIDYSTRPSDSNLGLIVKPGSGDVVKDSAVVSKLKSSFSDEVQVTLDSSRSSGTIRPVFRSATDDYYNFILVPVTSTK